MKALRYILVIFAVWLLNHQAAIAQLTWDRFGDTYRSSERPYGDITNFLILQGPGNENPGNYHDLQGDALRISPERKQFIARQFKYVLFDQDSFCDRDGDGGNIIQMMPPIYHQEAADLMSRNPDLIVFAYFSFTIIRAEHPWYATANQHEDWFLHERNSSQRLQSAEANFCMMDISNSGWRNFYAN